VNQRGRNFSITVNNYQNLLDWDELHASGAKYLGYSEEIGEEGTNHLQIALGFESTKSLRQVKQLIYDQTNIEAHIEIAKNPNRNYLYAIKGDHTCVGGPYEYGTAPTGQGKRNDLLEIKNHLDNGGSVKRCADINFGDYLRYGKALKEYKRSITQPRDFKTTVWLLVGPSGTGKSRTAHVLASYLSGGDYYVQPLKSSGQWFDDYSGQSVCLLDEFDGNRMQPTYFNSLCDRYQHVVSAHGSAGHQFVARHLIICSNYLPKFWWKKRNADQLKQITRRIDVWWPFLRYVPPRPPLNGISMLMNHP
jgi:hypothetical protein